MNKAFLNTVKSVNRADMSTTAKTVFIELMCSASQKKPHVFVDVQGLAESVGRAKSTIRKAVRELVSKGFLIWEGFVVQLKHKIYKLIFNVVKTETKPAAETKAKQSPEQPVDYGNRVVPNSQRAEYGEMIKCLTQFGLQRESIAEFLGSQEINRCRELIIEFMKNLRTDKTLNAELWFRQHRPNLSGVFLRS